MHVTFFADNGRHSWLMSNLLMRFNGLDDFNKIKSELTPEVFICYFFIVLLI